MPKLTDEAVNGALSTIPKWRLSDSKLIRDFEFADFVAAIRFVNQVADMAESANHHPDIDIRYNHVRLSLISHDTGGITKRDIHFAANVNAQFPPHSPE